MIESEQLAMDTAGQLKEMCAALGIPFIYKSSFDKANRSSTKSFRGLGLEEGLRILSEVKAQIGVPVLTDVHEDTPLNEVAAVVDVLQTPAFLCRQTNFIQNVARAGQAGQHQEGPVPGAVGHEERGRQGARGRQRADHGVRARRVSFGYNTLVSDMRGLAIMRDTGCPVVFDATHSVQQPGGQGTTSGGQREFVPVLARAAVAVGHCRPVRGNPSRIRQVRCPTAPMPGRWRMMKELLETLKEIDALVKQRGFIENKLMRIDQNVQRHGVLRSTFSLTLCESELRKEIECNC